MLTLQRNWFVRTWKLSHPRFHSHLTHGLLHLVTLTSHLQHTTWTHCLITQTNGSWNLISLSSKRLREGTQAEYGGNLRLHSDTIIPYCSSNILAEKGNLYSCIMCDNMWQLLVTSLHWFWKLALILYSKISRSKTSENLNHSSLKSSPPFLHASQCSNCTVDTLQWEAPGQLSPWAWFSGDRQLQDGHLPGCCHCSQSGTHNWWSKDHKDLSNKWTTVCSLHLTFSYILTAFIAMPHVPCHPGHHQPHWMELVWWAWCRYPAWPIQCLVILLWYPQGCKALLKPGLGPSGVCVCHHASNCSWCQCLLPLSGSHRPWPGIQWWRPWHPCWHPRCSSQDGPATQGAAAEEVVNDVVPDGTLVVLSQVMVSASIPFISKSNILILSSACPCCPISSPLGHCLCFLQAWARLLSNPTPLLEENQDQWCRCNQ